MRLISFSRELALLYRHIPLVSLPHEPCIPHLVDNPRLSRRLGKVQNHRSLVLGHLIFCYGHHHLNGWLPAVEHLLPIECCIPDPICTLNPSYLGISSPSGTITSMGGSLLLSISCRASAASQIPSAPSTPRTWASHLLRAPSPPWVAPCC